MSQKIKSSPASSAKTPTSNPSAQVRSIETKLELIRAAEKLCALNGLLGVSIRQIVAEANQRNASTIHYHFGSRDALIYAICEHRMIEIEKDRAQRLAHFLEQPHQTSDRVVELLSVFIWPSVQPIITHHGHSYFRRFFAHSFVNGGVDLPGFIKGKFDTGMRQIAGLVQQEVKHLSEATFRLRWALMVRSVTYLLANLEARAEGLSKAKATSLLQRGVLDISKSFAGMLQAPEHSLPSADIDPNAKSITKKRKR